MPITNEDFQMQWPRKDQIEALVEWARLNGRTWVSKLRDAWMDGDYNRFENSHLLQQVRNTQGPSWLTRHSAWITSLAKNPTTEEIVNGKA